MPFLPSGPRQCRVEHDRLRTLHGPVIFQHARRASLPAMRRQSISGLQHGGIDVGVTSIRFVLCSLPLGRGLWVCWRYVHVLRDCCPPWQRRSRGRGARLLFGYAVRRPCQSLCMLACTLCGWTLLASGERFVSRRVLLRAQSSNVASLRHLRTRSVACRAVSERCLPSNRIQRVGRTMPWSALARCCCVMVEFICD